MNHKIRIQSIEINQIKNVGYGKVTFQDGNLVSTRGAGILGVFGQNGSGKTALLDSLGLYRSLLSGRAINTYSGYLINLVQKEAIVNIASEIYLRDEVYHVLYHFKLGFNAAHKVMILEEELSYKNKTSHRYQSLLKAHYQSKMINLYCHHKPLVAIDPPKVARSALFVSEIAHHLNGQEREIFDALVAYGKNHILIINQFSNRDIRTKNEFPLIYNVKTYGEVRSAMKIRYGVNYLSDETLAIFKTIVAKISLLLQHIVPGVELVYREGKKSKRGVQVELVSKREDMMIPLQYESLGIKKLILILGSLISMVNADNVIVAIDEIDTGIFEYLLGEIFLVLKEEGKGQLLFTSHNLRPLEILNPYQVVFTTANPSSRYMSIKKTSKKPNLRDFYLRSIELGGQKENIYTATDPYEISRAFHLAGHDDEK